MKKLTNRKQQIAKRTGQLAKRSRGITVNHNETMVRA